MNATRRTFLVNGVLCGLSAPLWPHLERLASTRSSRSRAGAGERCLVVLQLLGGNDGLNTVVPHAQDAYYRMRPTLGQSRASLHRLDDAHGLHAALAPLAPLWAAGELAIAHGVGTPQPERSHFRALELWDRGQSAAQALGGPARDGWLGRLADQLARRDPEGLHALHLASPAAPHLPLALLGRRFHAPSLNEPDELRLEEPFEDAARAREALRAQGPAAGELTWMREAARAAERAAERMQAARSDSARDYPKSELARALSFVADLIVSDFGTRLFHVSLGGFDTHARQAAAHAALLTELGAALGAFHRDLTARGAASRTLTCVHSEFGRRAAENASGGTDHGAGAPVLLLGSRVRAGWHGSAPRLDALVEGDVPASTDFRSLYRGLEEHWLGLEPSTREVPALEVCERG